MECMKTSYQNDIRLLKKAKWKIMSSATIMYILICMFFFATYFILNQSFLPQSEFLDITYITATVISSIAWLLVLFVIDTGKHIAKSLFFMLIALQVVFSFWLLYKVYQDPSAWLVWLLWAILMLIETYFLFRFGRWIFNSFYGKIFFDKTLVIFEDQPLTHSSLKKSHTSNYTAESSIGYEKSASTPSRIPDFSSPDSYYQNDNNPESGKNAENNDQLRHRIARNSWISGIFMTEYEPLTYPRAAIRLGAIVYGEMVLFPILTEVCNILFKSSNGKFTFATSIMFTMCIISAVIWTIPIFFLYLKQTGVKALIIIGIGIEVIIGISYFYVLRGYYLHPLEDHVYRLSVFLWFAFFDSIRLLILQWAILPILKLAKPSPELDVNQFGEMKLFSNMSFPKVKLPDPKSIIDLILDIDVKADENLEDTNIVETPLNLSQNTINDVILDDSSVQSHTFVGDIVDSANKPEISDSTSKINENHYFDYPFNLSHTGAFSLTTDNKKINRKSLSRKDRIQQKANSPEYKTESNFNDNEPIILLPGDEGFKDFS